MFELDTESTFEADCETPGCDFTGEVDGTLDGDFYAWDCPDCGEVNMVTAEYPEPDWDMMNDMRREMEMEDRF